MRSSLAFLRKEITEVVRTPKGIVLPIVFVAFGFMSPVLAKMIPDIIPQVIKQMPGIPPGLDLTIKTTAADAWDQLFKNLNQMGLLIAVLMFMGTVSDEHAKGSVLLVLTKPLPRWGFLMSKYIAALLAVLVSLALSFGACAWYTKMLFGTALLTEALRGTALFAAYAALVLAITLLASSVSRSQAVSAGLAVGGLLVLSATSAIGSFGAKWSPGALSGLETRLVERQVSMAGCWPATCAALGLIVLVLAVTNIVYARKEL